MSGYLVEDTRKVTTHRLCEMKQQGKKIAMLTSYDFTMARLVDGAGIDIVLVGDSASNVMEGNTTTLPITLDEMIVYARSVVRGVKRALVVCDMPFGTYQINTTEGVRNAVRIMQETGCDCVKLEGGEEIIETVRSILAADCRRAFYWDLFNGACGHDDLRLSADVGVVDAMIVEGRRLFVNVSPEGDVDKDVAATSIDAPPDDTQATQPLGAY